MRHGALWLFLAYGFVFAALAVLAGVVTFLGNPRDGERVVVLDMHVKQAVAAPKPPPLEPPANPVATPPVPPEGQTVPPGAGQAAGQTPPATTPPAQTAAPPQTAAIPPPPVTPPPVAAPPETAPLPPPPVIGNTAVANPAVIEKTAQGPLPRIAENGTTPMRAYGMVIPQDGRPRIAIVIGGLGISAKSTAAAINGLPSGVTLAFAPYANDVQRWVTLARRRGHEVLLEVPMEPYDFPDSDPGQYTLRTGVGEEANTRKLVWSLTRFTGYVGVTNLLGGRMLSDPGALEPMLAYLTRRGLLFYDNGSTKHSVAADVAVRVGVPFSQATVTIDTIQAAMEIDQKLSQLETEARGRGAAAGSGFIYPVTIDRVNQWAMGLSGRGLVLAPISAVVSGGKH